MYLQASVSHRETNAPLAIQLPHSSMIHVEIEGGANLYSELHESVGVGFSVPSSTCWFGLRTAELVAR